MLKTLAMIILAALLKWCAPSESLKYAPMTRAHLKPPGTRHATLQGREFRVTKAPVASFAGELQANREYLGACAGVAVKD